MSFFKWLGNQLKQFIVAVLMIIFSVAIVPVHALGAEIRIEFTAPGDDGTVGTASEYLIFYSTVSFNAANVDSLVNVGIVDTAHFCAAPLSAGAVEQCTLTGLLDGTTYWIAIKAADEVPNWSELSNICVIQTDDIIPPSRITDLRTFLTY